MSIIKSVYSFDKTKEVLVEKAGRDIELLTCPYNKMDNFMYLLKLNNEGVKTIYYDPDTNTTHNLLTLAASKNKKIL